MKKISLVSGVIALLLLPFSQMFAQKSSSIREEIIRIPTYQVGDPDPNPRFYDGRVTQGAQE